MTEHTFGTLDYAVDEHIATITFNRPEELNSYSIAMKDDILAALDLADADDDVRVLIVTGAGKAFCAGMNLTSPRIFAREDEPFEDRLRDSGGEISLRLFNFTKPTIAAINGVGVGIGASITLPMDIRVMSTRAKLGFVFSQRGIVLESCSSWFLPRVVGITRAMEWALTGRLIDATEAEAAGLTTAVVEPDQVLATATDFARNLVQTTSAVSIALNRQLLWQMQGATHPMEANIHESRAMFALGPGRDCLEGVESFLERRPAEFIDTVPGNLPRIFHDRSDPEFRR